jgi:aminoglycoside phosphotransferase (APT) family kinase protein
MAPAPDTKLGEGREAEIFAWGDGLILRLMRNPAHHDRLEREAVALAAAAAAGAPVPSVHDRVSVQGRPGIVMDRVDGPDQLTLLGRQPWRVTRIARRLGHLHARIHEVTAPRQLPDPAQVARERIESEARLPEHLADFALRTLSELPRGERLCHGDFHPANVLVGPDGPKVIDWVAATRGDPHADVARTRLLLSVGEPPPGAPLVIRRLDRLGRRLVARGYLTSYLRSRTLDMELLQRWETVRAAERVWEDVSGESQRLVDILETRLAASRRP